MKRVLAIARFLARPLTHPLKRLQTHNAETGWRAGGAACEYRGYALALGGHLLLTALSICALASCRS